MIQNFKYKMQNRVTLKYNVCFMSQKHVDKINKIVYIYISPIKNIPSIQTNCLIPVSYTHLDVYKRQILYRYNVLKELSCFKQVKHCCHI